MDISLLGHQNIQTPQGVVAEGPQAGSEPPRETPALVVSETGAQAAGIPAAELEKSLTRTDDLGGLVDKALSGVPTDTVDEAVMNLLEADYESKKAVIDNLKPSEREIQLRKEAQEAAEKKAEEQRFEEVERERRRDQMPELSGDLRLDQIV